MNRRQFLNTAIGASLAGASGYAAEFADQKPLRVGLIGSGWYGKSDIFRLNQIAPIEIVSLCDVDKRNLEMAAQWSEQKQPSKKRPRLYTDYREMLKEKDLDLVEIATPDHWHALPMIAACQAGADIYVQKPISVDVVEGQAMVAAARKYKRVVQVGTQRRSTPHLIEARNEYIQSGKLGKIGLVEICCYLGGRATPMPEATPVPPELDYEFWTGPAPMFPYNRVRTSNWRAFMEYGNGTIGDMGIHMFDMVRWMMNLGWPKRISASGGLFVHKGGFSNIADTQTATFEYDDLTVVWNMRRWGAPPDPKYTWAGIFYGDRGTLKASVYGYDYIPAARGAQPVHKDVEYELEKYPEDNTEPRLEKHVAPAIRYHFKDLLAAMQTRSKPVADIEEGHISTACCILANISMQLHRSLTWDAKAGRVVGDEEANRLLRRPYRKPWVHPEVNRV
ncbi:MAG: Gfo/Idh/MocA family protein [Rhodospirillales bacterium]